MASRGRTVILEVGFLQAGSSTNRGTAKDFAFIGDGTATAITLPEDYISQTTRFSRYARVQVLRTAATDLAGLDYDYEEIQKADGTYKTILPSHVIERKSVV